VDAEETTAGRGYSASETKQAEEVHTDRRNTQEAMVETVTPYWQRPHGRPMRGPITGDHP
jgi:hypothetical protein